MDLSATSQQWVNVVLLWIGFSVVIGLVARAFLPGDEPKGALGTLVIGVVGSSVGSFFASLFWKMERFNPIGPLGFAVSVLAAMGVLLLFRFLLNVKFEPKSSDRS